MPREPMTAGQQALAVKYIAMAKAMAAPFRRAYRHDGDDYQGAALLGLVEAAQSFDPSLGVKFGTFARNRISYALRDERRRRYIRGYEPGTGEPPKLGGLGYDSEERGLVLNTTQDPPVGREAEADDEFEALVGKTVPSERPLLRMIYQDGCDYREAARRLGRAPSLVSVAHGRAVEQIRHMLGAG